MAQAGTLSSRRTLALPATWPAWALGAGALLLIAAFDLGPPLAFNDDWGMAWSVRHLNLLHPHVYPGDSALALPQIIWGWLFSLGGGDQRLLRLSELVFVGMTMYAGHRLARLLGAAPAESVLAALAPLALPVFTADATTFMTDVPYVGLLMLSALGAARWLHDGDRRGLGLCGLFAVLATLQRQIGVLIPLALTLTLLLERRRPEGREWTWLALLWAGCLAAVVLPAVTGLAPPTQSNRLVAALTPRPGVIVGALNHLPAMLGLGLLIFLPGLLATARGRLLRPATLLLATLLLAVVFAAPQPNPSVFPGNVFTAASLNWTILPGDKPPVFPGPLYLALELAALFTTMVLLVRTPLRGWLRPRSGPAGFLALLAATQLLPLVLLSYVAFDRYYLPVIAPLVPLAAWSVSGAPRAARSYALGLGIVVLGLALYAAGEQDYQAWQVARDQAARLAYETYSPYDVRAGYEAQAVYGEVPYYDRTGRPLSALAQPGAHDFSIDGPEHPLAELEFAPPDDPRPGFGYWSLAPGKIVIQPLQP